MADGKYWMTHNVNVNVLSSYRYEDKELNCYQYGRLYTWESAWRVCQSFGHEWQLPTKDEQQQMAKHYGGVRDDSDDGGKAAYNALVVGGSSGFNAVFGGPPRRWPICTFESALILLDGVREWSGQCMALQLGQTHILNCHNDGQKRRAFSVRCVRE